MGHFAIHVCKQIQKHLTPGPVASFVIIFRIVEDEDLGVLVERSSHGISSQFCREVGPLCDLETSLH